MNKKQFIFNKDNKSRWQEIAANATRLLQSMLYASTDFQLTVEPYSKDRSQNSLRAYWVLIDVVRNWMNDKGNNFSKEEVSSYFKIRSGFYSEMDGEKLPKSIANNSGCTYDDMRNIIESIINFGIENGIEDCEIVNTDLWDLLENYSK